MQINKAVPTFIHHCRISWFEILQHVWSVRINSVAYQIGSDLHSTKMDD
jgi:hypothetical protein